MLFLMEDREKNVIQFTITCTDCSATKNVVETAEHRMTQYIVYTISITHEM